MHEENDKEKEAREFRAPSVTPVSRPRAGKETSIVYADTAGDEDPGAPVKRNRSISRKRGRPAAAINEGVFAASKGRRVGRPKKEANNDGTKFDMIRRFLVQLAEIPSLRLAGPTVVVLLMISGLRFFFATETALPVSVTLSCLCLCLLLYLRTRPTRNGKVLCWIQYVQIFLGICAVGLLVWPHNGESECVPLTWSQYKSFCSAEGAGPIRAPNQEKCASLAGLHVQWDGLVESTHIISIQNSLADIVSKMPLILQRVISCIYGEEYEQCENDHECLTPDFLSKQINKCHLSNWNRYEYAIVIKMAAGAWMGDEAKVTLRADNVFRNFTTSLQVGDKIWFDGALEFEPTRQNTFATLRVHLHQSGCLSCKGSPRHRPV